MNKAATRNGTAADVGFEADLWRTADALRGSMDAAEYKHVVLGLIFLKYISDAFEEQHAKLEAEREQGADPEDRDEYKAENIFWVPPEARWSYLKTQARQSTIGQLIDSAMVSVERDNPSLKDVLPGRTLRGRMWPDLKAYPWPRPRSAQSTQTACRSRARRWMRGRRDRRRAGDSPALQRLSVWLRL